MAAGGLLILLNASWRDRAISPGPLSHPHAQLLANDLTANASGTGCAACHAAAERSVAGWTVALAGFHGGAASQTARCMECHDATISKNFALTAHSVDPASLHELTVTGNNRPAAGREFACATCHDEHQGAKFDIAAMSDSACQACHQQRYESFSTDHPDFGNWPYERRTRIAFNHASHRAKHFIEKKQAFECRSCHIEDATNKVQLLASYEKACASCHDEKIATSVAKGVPMLVLPTLDIEAMKAAGHDIGAWPKGATGDFDGRLPPVMKLLLASDAAARDAIITLGPDFDFMDVDPGDPIQLAACGELAKSIKSLFRDIGQRGQVAVRERLLHSLAPIDRLPDAKTLVAGLSQELVREAAAWFDDGSAEDASRPLDSTAAVKRDGEILASNSGLPIARPHGGDRGRALRLDPVGVWSRDDATFSLRYQPAAHADPVLTAWLELLATVPQLESRPIAVAMLKEMSSATAAGTCASCHSVEHGAAGRVAINWRAFDRANEPRTLTKFSHGPHVMLPQLADCMSCHVINGAADTSQSYASHDPHAFVSDFAPLSKQQCAQCHTAQAAGDGCQKCHNYHVDIVEEWRGGSRGEAESDVARMSVRPRTD
jgi:hypothetical protein